LSRWAVGDTLGDAAKLCWMTSMAGRNTPR